MFIKLAHIINPVVVGETSDLFTAQPITFQTLMEARRYALPRVPVELCTAQFAEDRELAPPEFLRTPNLERSILDFGTFEQRRKLPLIQDILGRLYEATDADYLIYTNVDIGLQPYFYVAVASLIKQGYDAFTVNRRVISDRFKRPEELPAIWAEVGKPHRGHDCFVFHRSLYPNFRFGHVCIGTGYIGKTLICNFLCHGKNSTLFADKHLTFHIGEDHRWRGGRSRDMLEFNKRECELAIGQLESEFGRFERDYIGEHRLKKQGAGRPLERLASAYRSLWNKK